jgi:hypothetical protein
LQPQSVLGGWQIAVTWKGILTVGFQPPPPFPETAHGDAKIPSDLGHALTTCFRQTNSAELELAAVRLLFLLITSLGEYCTTT